MGVGGEVQLSFFGSFSSGGGADGSYAAWPGEYAPVDGVESAPKLLGEDEACPAPSKLVGEYAGELRGGSGGELGGQCGKWRVSGS